MSDTPQGPGWWQASDHRWYPPEQAPGAAPLAPIPGVGAARGPAPGPLGPGWWQASDGQWYAPQQATSGPSQHTPAPAGPAPGPLGPGWWQASDGQWYAPQQATSGPSQHTPAPAGPAPGPLGPGWWQASDGQWYAPQQATSGPSQHAAAPGYRTPPAFPVQVSPAGIWRAPTGEPVPLASWGRRALATLIDVGIQIGAVLAFVLLGVLTGVFVEALGITLLVLGYVAVATTGIYFTVLNGTKGQTPGKALLGLKVVDSRTGNLIGGGMGFVRGLLHAINGFACYLGWLWPLWDDQRQTFSDKILSTVVLDHQPTKDFGIGLFKP